jgi:hypothetical protein
VELGPPRIRGQRAGQGEEQPEEIGGHGLDPLVEGGAPEAGGEDRPRQGDGGLGIAAGAACELDAAA